MAILITGASGGIGEEIARIYAKKGYNLVLTARREDRLKTLAEELSSDFSVNVEVIPADLSKKNQGREIKKEINSRNIDIKGLVNNAGFGTYGKFSDTEWEKESAMIDLNIHALTELTKLFLPVFLERDNGFIMNIASTASFQPGPLLAVYSASKAYVLSFTEAIAEEVRNSNVIVSAVCPGPTATGFRETSNLHQSRLFENQGKPAGSRSVAEFAVRSVEKKRRVSVHGFRNRVMALSTGFVPRNLLTRIVMKIAEPVKN